MTCYHVAGAQLGAYKMLLCSAVWQNMCTPLDIQNPLEKHVAASEDNDSVPDQVNGVQVIANIALPRLSEEKEKTPKHITCNIAALCLYKHAWRGAGLYYGKGDRQIDRTLSYRWDEFINVSADKRFMNVRVPNVISECAMSILMSYVHQLLFINCDK